MMEEVDVKAIVKGNSRLAAMRESAKEERKAAEAKRDPKKTSAPKPAKKSVKSPTGQPGVKLKAPVAEKPSKEKPNNSNYAGQATIESATCWQRAYDHFNDRLFEGKLSPAIIRLEASKKWAGVFRPDRWSRFRDDDTRIDEIVINPLIIDGVTDMKLLQTLVHEMAHGEIERQGNAPRKPYHCKRWCHLMQQIGLRPIIVDRKGKPTDKPTGKNAIHEMIKGGKFEKAAQELFDSGFKLVWHRGHDPIPVKKESKPKKKTTGKFVCPSCEEKATAKLTMSLKCVPCDVMMECEEAPAPEVEGGDEE